LVSDPTTSTGADSVSVASLSEEQVAGFFERYATAFDRRDWPVFVSLLHEPVLTVRSDGSVRCLRSHGEARAFFEGVADAWRHEGYHRFVASDYEIVSMGKRSLLVTLDWKMLREDGTVVRAWRQSYQLLEVENEWKVLAFTYHAQ